MADSYRTKGRLREGILLAISTGPLSHFFICAERSEDEARILNLKIINDIFNLFRWINLRNLGDKSKNPVRGNYKF
jgi:hypothetical protein